METSKAGLETREALPWASWECKREAWNIGAGSEVRGGVSGRERGGHRVTRASAWSPSFASVSQFLGLPCFGKSNRILPSVVGSARLKAPGSHLGVAPWSRLERLLLLELLQVLRRELTWRSRERGKTSRGPRGKERHRGHTGPEPEI